MLRRRQPLKPSRGAEIPAAVRREVRERDAGCVGRLLGWPGDCAGALEDDHVRASGALGRKSASTADNIVRLCGFHHRAKTENGRALRPALIEYLEGTNRG